MLENDANTVLRGRPAAITEEVDSVCWRWFRPAAFLELIFALLWIAFVKSFIDIMNRVETDKVNLLFVSILSLPGLGALYHSICLCFNHTRISVRDGKLLIQAGP